MASRRRKAPHGAQAKGTQVSFREDQEFADRVRQWAELEELSFADFVRKVFHVGLREYEKAGSLYALKTEERQAMLERQAALAKSLGAPAHERKAKAS
jgi:hypothetical protein